MDKIRQFLEILWQLPQFALGWLLEWWYGHAKNVTVGEFKGIKVVYSSDMEGGIALGNIIVLPHRYLRLGKALYVKNTLAHEYGHCLQSGKLGWFYLLVIGAPSLCWAWAHSTFTALGDVSYYDFYTERWADKLGGVKR